jgi:hypothetical protein
MNKQTVQGLPFILAGIAFSCFCLAQVRAITANNRLYHAANAAITAACSDTDRVPRPEVCGPVPSDAEFARAAADRAAWCMHYWQELAAIECVPVLEAAALECARTTDEPSDSGIAACYTSRGLAVPSDL